MTVKCRQKGVWIPNRFFNHFLTPKSSQNEAEMPPKTPQEPPRSPHRAPLGHSRGHRGAQVRLGCPQGPPRPPKWSQKTSQGPPKPTKWSQNGAQTLPKSLILRTFNENGDLTCSNVLPLSGSTFRRTFHAGRFSGCLQPPS